jgi:hypothetical protein
MAHNGVMKEPLDNGFSPWVSGDYWIELFETYGGKNESY